MDIVPALTVEADNPPVSAWIKPDVITRISKQKEGETNAYYLIRKDLEKSKDIESAEVFFEVLLKNANTPNSVGRVFTDEEIGKAFVECMSILNPSPAKTLETMGGACQAGKGGKGKGKLKGGKGSKSNCKQKALAISEHHVVMFMYNKKFENPEFGFNKYLAASYKFVLKPKDRILSSPTR